MTKEQFELWISTTGFSKHLQSKAEANVGVGKEISWQDAIVDIASTLLAKKDVEIEQLNQIVDYYQERLSNQR
jgi:hypothetical protein